MSKGKQKSRVNVKKSKKRLRRKFFIIIPILVLLLAGGAYAAHLYNKAETAADNAYDDSGKVKSDLREDLVNPDIHNVSILLLGIDENDDRKQKEVARSDAMVLATLNKDEKSIKLLSIPRDSLVYIPEVGYEDKINHAYAFGEVADPPTTGTSAVIDTVENLLEIPVDYYVKLNFNAFIEIIDAIGGITVDVPYAISELNSQDQKHSIQLEPGEQLLYGEEALALARTRKQDSDYDRGKRQMEIIDAIIDKSFSITSVLKYGDMIEALGDNMSTNMTFEDMKSFFSYATQGKGLNIEKYSLEGYDYWPENIYYWQVDEVALEETKNKLKAHLDLPTYAESNEDKSDEYQSAESDYLE